jgi:hypothetical protein
LVDFTPNLSVSALIRRHFGDAVQDFRLTRELKRQMTAKQDDFANQ